MKNIAVVGIVLLVLFSTFIPQKKTTIKKFNIQEIEIENNVILGDEELIKEFNFLYNKNLIFLNAYEIKKKMDNESFIKNLEIKKVYPEKIIIKVFEKEPIAIFINQNKKKFYLGKKIDLIKYRKIKKYENLPIIEGELNSFKILFNNLIKINFPTAQILSYRFFNLNRWDIEMTDERILKLPKKNYNKYLIKFMSIKDKTNFEKYKIFDYRLKDQLILK